MQEVALSPISCGQKLATEVSEPLFFGIVIIKAGVPSCFQLTPLGMSVCQNCTKTEIHHAHPYPREMLYTTCQLVEYLDAGPRAKCWVYDEEGACTLPAAELKSYLASLWPTPSSSRPQPPEVPESPRIMHSGPIFPVVGAPPTPPSSRTSPQNRFCRVASRRKRQTRLKFRPSPKLLRKRRWRRTGPGCIPGRCPGMTLHKATS